MSSKRSATKIQITGYDDLFGNKSSSTIEKIATEKLIDHEDNEWLFGYSDLEHLAESISKNGFHGAIEVYDLGNGMYEIASGHRRSKSSLLAGLTEIPCEIKPLYTSQAERNEWLLDSNLKQRGGLKGFDPIHIARMMEWYFEKIFLEQQENSETKDNKKAALAKKFKMSESLVYKYLAINNYIDEIKSLIEQGCPFSAFYGIQNKDEDTQRKVSKQIMEFIAKEGLESITSQKIHNFISEPEQILEPVTPKEVFKETSITVSPTVTPIIEEPIEIPTKENEPNMVPLISEDTFLEEKPFLLEPDVKDTVKKEAPNRTTIILPGESTFSSSKPLQQENTSLAKEFSAKSTATLESSYLMLSQLCSKKPLYESNDKGKVLELLTNIKSLAQTEIERLN